MQHITMQLKTIIFQNCNKKSTYISSISVYYLSLCILTFLAAITSNLDKAGFFKISAALKLPLETGTFISPLETEGLTLLSFRLGSDVRRGSVIFSLSFSLCPSEQDEEFESQKLAVVAVLVSLLTSPFIAIPLPVSAVIV